MKTSQDTNTLFGNDESYQNTQQKPIIVDCEEWPPLERLNREKELIGIYLSSHPLDNFKLEMKYFTKNKVADLQNLDALLNKNVSIAGLVTEVNHLTAKTGKPYGKFTMEDFTDSYQFYLFGKDYEKYRNYLFDGYSLLIKGVVKKRDWGNKDVEFKINSINILANVREDLVKEIALNLPLSEISESTIDDIL
jgi:DNA polymerase-3 subunit alpha